MQRDIAPGVVTVPASSALGGFRWGLQQFPPWLSGWLYSGLGPDLILGCRRTVLAGGSPEEASIRLSDGESRRQSFH